MDIRMHNWLMDEIPKQLHKASLTKDDMYDNLSRPYEVNSWRVLVRKSLFNKEDLEWLESVKKTYKLKTDEKNGFLVII
jgi:hypothetical protein